MEIRTITTPAAEDEMNLSKFEMQFNIFKALLSDFLDSAKEFISDSEIKSLPHGGYVITFEQAMPRSKQYYAAAIPVFTSKSL